MPDNFAIFNNGGYVGADPVEISVFGAVFDNPHPWTASIEGVPGVIATKSGSGAGTPLADLMYVVAMSKVMFQLRST